MNDEIKEILDNTLEYLEGIDETRNTKILTTNEVNILLDYITNLQSNWNSLKDWVFEHIDSIEFNSYDDVLDKMNELEGVDNENN